jgi:hypothetical protein
VLQRIECVTPQKVLIGAVEVTQAGFDLRCRMQDICEGR